ncbi:hypothetical protein PCASD_08758 [Puccinia coronata f. sp. avenae]|uniref:Uncharacterized protein n=1 Tax=Puccinia coronata f. sp. avenae TaxID=200324 RepID=A0A2N5TE66_9BASI|nr:hypothetical protein PCASD_08758 [Puccinia coronata f. sp. avenae]
MNSLAAASVPETISVAILLKSPPVAPTDCVKKRNSSSLEIETLSPLDVTSTPPANVLDVDLETETPTIKSPVDVVPPEDNAECRIMTPRSILVGAGLNQSFRLMSASLLASNGKPYPYLQAIHEDGTVNENFIQRTGLPFFTATNYLVQIFSSITLTSSISHAALNNYHIVGPLLTKSKSLEKVDPHRIACQKYKDLPSWGKEKMNPDDLQKQLAELMQVVSEEQALRKEAKRARQQAKAQLAE